MPGLTIRRRVGPYEGRLAAIVVQRVRIPYTVAQVLVGIVLAAVELLPATALSPDLVLGLLLPPLLFEAAFTLCWEQLASVSVPVAVLATVGLATSALVSASILAFVGALPWSLTVLFGILVAATDPVVVVAFRRRARVAPELRTLVEGERLLNDGTAVVLVGVLGGLAAGGGLAAVASLADFARVAAGGLAVGGAVGLAGSALARGTGDHLVGATVSVATAYGS